ncbi:hypothetical protein [Actinomadura sp. NPDC000600]|uniref:hypothetical protein n=1 Tax=Actinomadura sp. NPDC000600 TaxID=3154262 RepID=UPI00339115BD
MRADVEPEHGRGAAVQGDPDGGAAAVRDAAAGSCCWSQPASTRSSTACPTVGQVRPGVHWFGIGGRNGPRPAADAGDTMATEARARYVRVVGTGNTANLTFHLTEVSVYGTPVA